MNLKTVVHVYDYLHPHKGGPPQVILNLAKAQRAQGLEIRLISIDADEPEVIDFIKRELGELPPTFVLKPRGLRPLLSRGILQRALHDVSTVHLHSIWPTPNLYVAHYCLQKGIPYLLSIHGHLRPEALAIKSFKKKIGLALGYRAMLDGAEIIHALNESEAKDVGRFGLSTQVNVIPNGVCPERFAELPTREILDQAIPDLADSPYLIFLSRIHPPKGAGRLAQAFVKLSQDYPELHLVVAGSDFGGIDEIKAIIGEGTLQKRVHFPGFLGGHIKNAALSHAVAFCLPSDHEGFSVAVLEALAWGVPTVISTGCHFPEVAEAGAGWVHELNVASLYATLSGVLSSPHQSQKVAKRGQAWTLEHFSWSQIERTYAEVYDQMMRSEQG
jgi:glycosyltransferase involved in cell wall biosynthesis